MIGLADGYVIRRLKMPEKYMTLDFAWLVFTCKDIYEAANADIDRLKKIIGNAGLMPVPMAGVAANPVTDPSFKKDAVRALQIAAKIVFDPVNHMTYDRIYESGRYMKCAIEMLGDRIGVIHVKDVYIDEKIIPVVGIRETRMGVGLLDHETLIRASASLEPWKFFSLEHIRDRNLLKPAFDYIQGIAVRIGHKFTDPRCTRERWEKGLCR